MENNKKMEILLQDSLKSQDFSKAIDVLKQMLENEIYISQRIGVCNIDDFILKYFPPHKVLGCRSVDEFNEQIDAKKKSRLSSEILNIDKQTQVYNTNYTHNLEVKDIIFILTYIISKESFNIGAFTYWLDQITYSNEINGIVGLGGHKPLYTAVGYQSEEAILLLQEKGFIEDTDRSAKSLVYYSTSCEFTEFLVHSGYSPNILDYDGNSPLHKSIILGNEDMARMLVRCGADIHQLNGLNNSPLVTCVKKDDFIMQSPFFPRYNKEIIEDDRKKIKIFLEAEIQEKKRKYLLFESIRKQTSIEINLASYSIQDSDVEAIIEIIELKKPFVVSMNLSNNIDLSQNKIKELLDFLYEKTFTSSVILDGLNYSDSRFNVDNGFLKFLDGYSKVQCLEAIKYFYINNVDFSIKTKDGGWGIIHFASRYGHLETINFLLKKGVIINSFNEDGEGGLHLAATWGHCDIIKAFLKEKLMQVDLFNNSNVTPLVCSVQNKHHLCTEVLLSYGSNPNHHHTSLQSPLEIAIGTGCVLNVQLLLEKGAKVKFSIDRLEEGKIKTILKEKICQIKESETKLINAVENNNLEEVIKHLKLGVDPNIKNGRDEPIIDYSVKINLEITAWLLHNANRESIESLDLKKKEELGKHLSKLRKKDPLSTAYFFISKTSYPNNSNFSTDGNFSIDRMFKELFGNKPNDQIDEEDIEFYTRPIMQYVEKNVKNNFEITYVEDGEDIILANPTASPSTLGTYSPLNNKIQIAGKRDNHNTVRGGVIHELCHLACYLAWNNNCNPYSESSAEQTLFKSITNSLLEEDNRPKSLIDTIINDDVFSKYDEDKFDRELIVRIPQAIATHGLQAVKSQFEVSPAFERLFNYYKDVVLVKLKEDYLVKRSIQDKTSFNFDLIQNHLNKLKMESENLILLNSLLALIDPFLSEIDHNKRLENSEELVKIFNLK